MKKLFISLSLLTGLYSGAQNTLPKCAEHTVINKWLQDNPDKVDRYRQSRQDLENFTQNFQNSNDSRSRGVVYTIPMVFHIIHDYGASNITDDQIYDQVAILNRDYRLQNTDAANVVAAFQGLPADIEIEFALATKKPNGQCFSGITRTVSTATSGNQNAQVSAVQSVHGNFPGDMYLNVFVVTEASGAAGYTFQPSFWGDQMDAGIYIQHSYVGSIGTGNVSTSRALTHEVGHWLNLSHTWGDNNNPGVACGNDQVADTPETKGWTSCTLSGTTCNGQLDNVENYMEYSYCSKMFTPGQKSRMRAAIVSSTGGRNNLWTAQNLAATGADGTNTFCKADFEADRNYTCVGGSVQFTDLSYTSPTNWTWSANGGTPNNANAQNPSITFNTPGLQSVTLLAGDVGSTDTEVKNNYIHVFPTTPGSFPYMEDFEGYSSLPTSGIVSGFDGHPYSWQIYNGVGASGSKAIQFNSFACPYEQLDREFISYPIDLSVATAGSIEFTFKTVYKETDNMNGAERLTLYLSDDCGETWTLGRKWFSSQLTNGTSNTSYTPSTSGEYVMQSYSIPDNFKVSNFIYKMVWRNTGGNNIYIDDINIGYTGTAGIEEKELSGVSVFPNPFGDQITVKAQSNLKEAEIRIFDARGKLIKSMNKDIIDNLIINTSEFSQGLYIMEIRNGGFAKSFRIVK